MGYGGTLRDAGQAVGESGDGGIDGIIKEDRLGLDVIYIQAKRWDSTVGRPEIQKFAGALQGHCARKGVFITTSGFSAEATDFGRTRSRNLTPTTSSRSKRTGGTPVRQVDAAARRRGAAFAAAPLRVR